MLITNYQLSVRLPFHLSNFRWQAIFFYSKHTCVCLTINTRKKFTKKIYIPYRTKPTVTRPCFCCNVGADIFVGITIYRSHKKVVSAGPWKHPKPPHNLLAPESTFTRINCVNSSPVSTRPRVNSSSGQLEPGSTRTWVSSSQCQLAPGQLVPESTRPRVTLRPRVNSSPSQLVPGSTRDCTCPWSTCTHVNSHPSHPTTESTRTQVNSHPGTCLSHYPPTYLPTLPPTYLNTYLPPFIPPSLQTCIPTSPTLHTPPCLFLYLPTPSLHYLTSHSLPPYLHTVPP